MRRPITDPAFPAEDLSPWRRLPSSGRLFVRFWGTTSVLALLLALSLRGVGPHPHQRTRQDGPDMKGDSSTPSLPGITQGPNGATAPAGPNFPEASSPEIAPPEAALLEVYLEDPSRHLPVRGANGSMPRVVYAAPVPQIPGNIPRVALLVDDIGMSASVSQEALNVLPASISVAFSSYAPDPTDLLALSRRKGHEIFLSLPMQPRNAPADSEGPRALGYDHTVSEDSNNLLWSLSRFEGYVGVTNAFAGQTGAAFALSPDFRMVASELDRRGLLYLNAHPGGLRYGPVPGGDASVMISTDTDAETVRQQLAQLVTVARNKGSAIGVTGPLRPVAVREIASWAAGLKDQGVALVPVSSLSNLPAPQLQAMPAGGIPASIPQPQP
ncbi:divergent polysaccharide deacetylase family protein [Acetobacter sp. AN02]|uniref:divergent polysaccharide deacetylase family protein n=1 Tax=Acetobacter sp. AN02 TaxID=2894186 RepID=UPI0024344BB5|nr:divergent polysaccharide deacetylase family protein [Acetobacter sp. AN02]MDG6094966.1 divergent polysaccharide deacetylase family protein [Acetobacter sp. AN02]